MNSETELSKDTAVTVPHLHLHLRPNTILQYSGLSVLSLRGPPQSCCCVFVKVVLVCLFVVLFVGSYLEALDLSNSFPIHSSWVL
jgi:hypothetical protein